MTSLVVSASRGCFYREAFNDSIFNVLYSIVLTFPSIRLITIFSSFAKLFVFCLLAALWTGGEATWVTVPNFWCLPTVRFKLPWLLLALGVGSALISGTAVPCCVATGVALNSSMPAIWQVVKCARCFPSRGN